jgi:hypothetical protein
MTLGRTIGAMALGMMMMTRFDEGMMI